MKNKLFVFIMLVVIFCSIVFANSTVQDVFYNSFPITVNGQTYTSEMPILSYQGRTYLPLREFGNVTGVNVDFQNSTILVDNYRKDSLFDYIYYANTLVTTLDFVGDSIDHIENSYLNYYSFNKDATYILSLVQTQEYVDENAIPICKEYFSELDAISTYLGFSNTEISQISQRLDTYYTKVDTFNTNITNALKKPMSDTSIINEWSELEKLRSEIYYSLLNTITLANMEYYT